MSASHSDLHDKSEVRMGLIEGEIKSSRGSGAGHYLPYRYLRQGFILYIFYIFRDISVRKEEKAAGGHRDIKAGDTKEEEETPAVASSALSARRSSMNWEQVLQISSANQLCRSALVTTAADQLRLPQLQISSGYHSCRSALVTTAADQLRLPQLQISSGYHSCRSAPVTTAADQLRLPQLQISSGYHSCRSALVTTAADQLWLPQLQISSGYHSCRSALVTTAADQLWLPQAPHTLLPSSCLCCATTVRKSGYFVRFCQKLLIKVDRNSFFLALNRGRIVVGRTIFCVIFAKIESYD